jgi:hypothetical protein
MVRRGRGARGHHVEAKKAKSEAWRAESWLGLVGEMKMLRGIRGEGLRVERGGGV